MYSKLPLDHNNLINKLIIYIFKFKLLDMYSIIVAILMFFNDSYNWCHL
jgi:hypothetical protein